MFNISDNRKKENIVKKIVKEQIVTPCFESVKEAIMKKALGYEIKEIAEEYVMADDELKLIKRKVNTKIYPPDLDAIAMIVDKEKEKESDYACFSDEELLEEKDKLIKLFKKLRGEKLNAED